MSLPWVRFDTSLPDHPKILALLELKDGHRSAFVYCCALAYAGKHGTDGLISRPSLSRINGRPADADRLVQVGLLDDEGEDGWRIHNWANRQELATVTEMKRAAQRVGGQKGNCVRHHGPNCGCWREQA